MLGALDRSACAPPTARAMARSRGHSAPRRAPSAMRTARRWSLSVAPSAGDAASPPRNRRLTGLPFCARTLSPAPTRVSVPPALTLSCPRSHVDGRRSVGLDDDADVGAAVGRRRPTPASTAEQRDRRALVSSELDVAGRRRLRLHRRGFQPQPAASSPSTTPRSTVMPPPNEIIVSSPTRSAEPPSKPSLAHAPLKVRMRSSS